MMKTLLAALSLAALLVTGCVTNTITNLTSSTVARDPKGMYRVEYQWDSNQQTVRPETIKPFVISGAGTYEMKPVMKMNNRWETWIPVPPNQNSVEYFIKVDFQYTVFGGVKNASKRTKDYVLNIK